jgi:hypothetical protein
LRSGIIPKLKLHIVRWPFSFFFASSSLWS